MRSRLHKKAEVSLKKTRDYKASRMAGSTTLEIRLNSKSSQSRLSTLNELDELEYYLSEEDNKKESERVKNNLSLTHMNEDNVNLSFNTQNSQSSDEL